MEKALAPFGLFTPLRSLNQDRPLCSRFNVYLVLYPDIFIAWTYKLIDYRLILIKKILKQESKNLMNTRGAKIRLSRQLGDCNYVRIAIQRPGNPVDSLVQLLETRLDAIVHRAGLARTIYAARQFISQGHILVNGKKVDVPSQRLAVNNLVTVKEESRKLAPFIEAAADRVARIAVSCRERSREQMSAKLVFFPRLSEVPLLCEMSMVIEFYSR